MWGFALKEWKGVTPRTKTTIIVGVITIILSVALVGYGNALK
jgi:L-rhamnose-H+ transport protein